MAVIQSTQSELRYSKRQNLEQEAAVVGNYYRDIIRSYGVDCNYYKQDLTEFNDFKKIIDQNTILKHAYGYNITPDYSVSSQMLTYMEVENDIFQLQKFGETNNMDVNFYFDATDFACALATKVGQFKEYKIKEKEIVCEVPDCISDLMIDVDPNTGKQVSAYLSDNVFPYQLGLGYAEEYECEMLKGKLSVEIEGYEFDKEYMAICHPYEHSDFNVTFPANKHLYQSLKHEICNDDYLDTYIYLKYVVSKVMLDDKHYKCILRGKINGGILFYDINSLGKYIEKIHPMVGDIVTIDFPDEYSREQYEIVDCFDKQLTPDGISPLLHKYIWKCKARRYVNTDENMEKNEANERLDEKLRQDSNVKEEIAKEISVYDDNEDAAYGGYDGVPNEYDSKIIDPTKPTRYEFLDDHTAIDIMKFGCGSKLVTNGYDLIFVDANGQATDLITKEFDFHVNERMFESGLRWLKATDSAITFTDIDGTTVKLAEDTVATQYELEICLDSLYDKTTGLNINKSGENFIKFTGCKSYLFATDTELFAKLESNQTMYKLT